MQMLLEIPRNPVFRCSEKAPEVMASNLKVARVVGHGQGAVSMNLYVEGLGFPGPCS